MEPVTAFATVVLFGAVGSTAVGLAVLHRCWWLEMQRATVLADEFSRSGEERLLAQLVELGEATVQWRAACGDRPRVTHRSRVGIAATTDEQKPVDELAVDEDTAPLPNARRGRHRAIRNHVHCAP